MDLFDCVGGASDKASPFVRVELPGPPQGKARARGRIVTTKSGQQFINFYTPAGTRSYEDGLAMLAKSAMRRNCVIDQAVAIRVTATMPIPKSWSNKKRDAALAGTIHPTVKPDWDNIGKLTDAFKGIVWTDDTRVVRALVIKQYGENPSLVVEVFPM